MDKLLNAELEGQIKEVFQGITDPVVALFFGSKLNNCNYCQDTLQMLQELVSLSDKIELQIYDLEENSATAEQYHVTMAPGIVMTRKNGTELVDYGVRFAGIPAGHEFTSLVRSFLLVSNADSGLKPATKKIPGRTEKTGQTGSICDPDLPVLPAGGDPGPSDGC